MSFRIRLVEGWQELHKASSVIAASFFAALYALGPTLIDAWNMVPSDLKAALPEGAARWLSIAAFVLLVLFRYTKIERKKGSGDGSL
ncbi:DUF7940 domain-containing protein [Bordetella genomosp. 9]|uniref:Holin n=1 Tax=Bordetella genomosp. 9 TaxID=1416803 RepID=A0A1W6YYX7_9BORD|nr:hypothetical protein [Bordetella genomosp. 9]ARP86307.1 hypothetical protein CAL13_08930 [Bordetella genomosp. 9]